MVHCGCREIELHRDRNWRYDFKKIKKSQRARSAHYRARGSERTSSLLSVAVILQSVSSYKRILSEAPFTKWLFFVEKMEDESDGGYRCGSDDEAYHEHALEEGRCRRINARFNRLEEAYRQLALEQERSSSSNEFLNSVFTAPLENTSDVGSGDEHVPEADEADDQQWMENLGTAASNLIVSQSFTC